MCWCSFDLSFFGRNEMWCHMSIEKNPSGVMHHAFFEAEKNELTGTRNNHLERKSHR